jgi:iron complex transport system substrate-binding protein
VMGSGHWVPGMVDRVGGSYGLAASGERSRPREWSEIRSADPEVLVAAPCGFDLTQTVESIGDLTGREGWSGVTAVENGRVYLVDGNQYVNRPGPRLVETLELLAGVLYPEADGTPTVADRSGVRQLGTLAGGPQDPGPPA